MGGMNADVSRMRNLRDQQVDNFLASIRSVDLLGHFQ